MPRETVYLGAGTLSLVDKSVTPNQPVPVVALQDISVDFAFESKELMGENQFPIAVGRTAQKITVKAKSGDINGALFAKVLGYTTAAGMEAVAQVTAAASTSVTPTVPSSGTWTEDLGVRSATGALMNPVASGPVAGTSYTVAAGVYTFNAAESGNIQFRFAYSMAAVGTKATVSQTLAQAAPTFEGVLYNSYTNPDGTVNQEGIRFYCMASTKLSMAKKRDNYTEADLEFIVYARPSDGVVYNRWST